MESANISLGQKTDRRNPRLDSFKFTLKLFIKNKTAFVGLIIVVIYAILTILDFVYPQYLGASNINTILSFTNGVGGPQPPITGSGWWRLLGTTGYNRIAIFPAMLAALKVDIPISFEVVIFGAIIGAIIGTASGFLGGYLDEVVMRVTDVFFSVPFLIMAIAFVIVFRTSLPGLDPFILALIITWWPIYARVTRGLALTIKSQKFVEAAVAAGASRARNIFVHVLPNVLSPIFVQISLDLGTIVQIFATLFFLGFAAASPDTPELGNLMVQGINYFPTGDWWPLVVPGVFLVIFTIAVNLVGDGLRDVLDPRVRR